MSNQAAKKFLEVFANADAIEIDGFFIRHYDNTVHSGSGDPSETAIELTIDVEGREFEIIIEHGDLNDITLCDEGNQWTVGRHDICFFTVQTISTNPAEV
ncbi:hypothetical protein [Marinobacter sp. F3R08]|uniref:hypothetical protein n=1 Tax=Marinobacter sp. F3R08 TaxID=2841559 RepID=UPI001C09116B|nr:hypothetical protein [Marinobacter sp. F3R08]MBU2952187.1 hypothetical protein [Marinobacter sp. F3R08]